MPVHYSEAVEAAMAEVCPPRDALDAGDFDPVLYLNSRFPDEASLGALPAFLDEANERLRKTENQLLKAVEQQASNASSAEGDLKGAKEAVAQLYVRVSEIKTQASDSEEMVKDLCQNIRELDVAKTNLTASINTLRSVQLWMLQLQVLSASFDKRRFLQTRDALQEALKYSAMFDKMKDIPKVKELNDKQTQLCRQVEYHIRNTVFGEMNLEAIDENAMAEACAVVDLMEEESKKKLRDRFIDKLLESYALRFKRGTDEAKLERTERRYVFLRGLLERYENAMKNVFPRHWCVPQELCVTFCLRTKQELDYALRETANEIDVVVLTYVIQKTIDMERDMTQAMTWKDEFPGKRELPVYRYSGMILSAFKEHMGLLVQNEDRLMREALAQPLIGSGDALCPGWNSVEDETRSGTYLPIAEDIFVFIKESLKRALRIAQQDVLLEMAGVWRRHLIELAQAITTLLASPATSPLERRRACIILNTADLCQSTSQDLGDEVCARSEAPPREVAFDQVKEAFSAVYTKSIQAILQGLELELAPMLVDYGNGGFLAKKGSAAYDVDGGGAADESKLVRDMTSTVHDTVLACAAVMPATALRFLLDKLAAIFIPEFGNALYRLRRLPDDGISAMRVDAAALEKTFLQLPNYNDPSRFAASALTGYMRLVRREFDQLNRALKVLQVDARTDAFIDVYYEVVLPEDRSIHNFVRLVELKGLRREDVRAWVATLSKRGVVEATKRDFQREASLGLSTGVSTTPSTAASITSGVSLNFAALFTRDPASAAAASAAAASPTTTTSNSHFSLSNFVSNIGGGGGGGATSTSAAVNGAAPHRDVAGSAGGGGGGAGDGAVEEESLGSRFAAAARNTATSINFLNKFKRNEAKQ
ncbi:vps53-like domain protein [Novymonas esmeraldas]|uniref:Vps53-like domain protein n=1 Tax=Novymonas esmeraldas TaxID=1808958 RepID=A0AAW0ER41_9TRYP